MTLILIRPQGTPRSDAWYEMHGDGENYKNIMPISSLRIISRGSPREYLLKKLGMGWVRGGNVKVGWKLKRYALRGFLLMKKEYCGSHCHSRVNVFKVK